MINIKSFLMKLKSDRKNRIYFFSVIIVSILLVLINVLDNNKELENTTENESNIENSLEYDYIENMEATLTNIISKIDGAGDTLVMITAEGTSKYEYAKEESDEIIICDENGLPITISISNPEITGVLVICEGGDISAVKEKIYNAISTSLGIGTNQIYVTKKVEKETYK